MKETYIFMDKNRSLDKWCIHFYDEKIDLPKRFKEEGMAMVFSLLLYQLSLRKKQTSFSVYFCDLKKLKEIIANNVLFDDLNMEEFKHKGIYYCIKISNPLYKNKSLILKDYFSFITIHKESTPMEEKIEALKNFINLIYQTYNISINRKKTLSLTSVAMQIFKKVSREKAKMIKKANGKEDSFIRKSFYGGRSEIFVPSYPSKTNVKGSLYFYDVNSLYPFIMATNYMPIGIPTYIPGPEVDITCLFGFVDVLVQADDNAIPLLPIRHERYPELGVIYPNGTFRGCYFSMELRNALKYNYKILKIYGAYSFKYDIVFDTFVNHVFNIRRSIKDPIQKKLLKLILNSVYGKYAGIYEGYALSVKDKEAVRITYMSVAISSAIAAYSRIYMYSIIKDYSKDLLYWDTDGIILKKALESRHIGNALGKFRLVDEIKSFAALAPKFYMYINAQLNYILVFRGVTIDDYLIDYKLLHRTFLYFINRNLNKKTTIEVQLLLTTKTNEEKSLQFSFGNKRCFYTEEGLFKSRPWNFKRRAS